MINHARTLLLNKAPGNLYAPGEEFVPPDFAPVLLTEPFLSLRRILFGASPDRMFANYRMQQYMSLLHATELESFVTDLDSRITYWPPQTSIFFEPALYEPLVLQTAGSLAGSLQVTHVAEIDEVAGRMVEAWQITVISGNAIRAQRFDKPFSTTLPITVVRGTSAVVQLPGSQLQITIGKANYDNSPVLSQTLRLFGKVDGYINNYDRAMYLTPPYARYLGESSVPSSAGNNLIELVGASWHIEVAAKPATDASRLTTQLTTELPASWPAQLFGLVPSEPFKTFQQLWQTHPALPYRLGGLLLALIYQTDRRR